MLRILLEREKHKVYATTSGMEARQHLEENSDYDLILCDLIMPDFSGMDLYTWLSQQGGQMPQMVLMTGGAFTVEARRFLEEVSAPTLQKPFELDCLHKLIQEHANIRRRVRA